MQVIDRAKEAADDDDEFVRWRGCSLREIYEIDQLARITDRYAVLTSGLRATLYGDKDEGR